MDWCATVYWPPMREVFWGLIRTPPEKRNPELIESSRKKAGEILKILDAALADSDYVAGAALTIGDIPLGAISWRWFGIDGLERAPLPNVEAWFERLSRREAFRKSVLLPLN
jgi:glutathione S-transferase